MESGGKFCDLCRTLYPTVQAYDQHLFNVWEIEDDLKSFTTEDTVDIETFICSICQLQLKNAKGLKQHIGKVHNTKFKGVYCSTCHKKFKHKYALRFHINQVHEQATRVVCVECGQAFYNKYMLRSHQLKHHPFLII